MSNLEIFFSQSDQIKEDLNELFEICEKIIFAAVETDQQSLINIKICDAREVRELNLKWRGKDTVTDVLSFENVEPDFGPMKILGDLVICLEQAQEQAKELGHSLSEEIAVLTAHGYCHLIGLDHELGTSEAKEQLAEEMKILKKAGFNKELSLIARNF